MEQYDLVIRNGAILDGSGAAAFAGDVAIRAGRICEVGAGLAAGREEIDAGGRLVTPGFVDVHTHYDGQVTWENRLKPSSEHGVTTVVMGNCGVGFAPCKPEERGVLVRVMEGVEDIPEIVLTEGVPWTWRTFPEYLEFLASRSYDADCAAYLPHAALRVFVMGERAARREKATAEDCAKMTELVAEAVNAGAIGVSTSRLLSHRDSGGGLAPHVHTDREELFALAEGLRRAGKGVFQIASGLANQQLASVIPGAAALSPQEAARQEIDLFADICRASGRPLTFALSIINAMPDMAPYVLELVGEANRQPGVKMLAQVFPRPIGILFGLDLSMNPFKLHPGYKAIEHLPLAERVAKMREPQVRAQILSQAPDPDHPDPIQRFLVAKSFDSFPFPDTPDYEPDAQDSLRARAGRLGKAVEEVAYDALLERDGAAILFLPINNFPGDLESLGGLLASEDSIIGLGDGGAHMGLICDASFPAFLMTYWVRDRTKGGGPRFTLAQAVNRLTRRNAEAMGLMDRGLIAKGLKADLNIIDYDELALSAPQVAFDLPAGGRRVSQKLTGLEATIVSGQVTYRRGAATEALPGRLVRA